MTRIRFTPRSAIGVVFLLAVVAAVAIVVGNQWFAIGEFQDQVNAARAEIREMREERNSLDQRLAATETQLERARADLKKAQKHAAAAAAQAKQAQAAAQRAQAAEAEAAAAAAQRESVAAAAVDDRVITGTFTDPADATAFLNQHGGGSCDWASSTTIYCEFIPPR